MRKVLLLNGLKRCSGCNAEKPASAFYPDKTHSSGLKSNCRKCATEACRKWQEKHADHCRDYRKRRYAAQNENVRHKNRVQNLLRRLKKVFGITQSEYASMVASQGGKCAICLDTMVRPCVDHDHETGKVRELLCGPCNSAIGLFREDLDVMQRAMDYLRKHRAMEFAKLG